MTIAGSAVVAAKLMVSAVPVFWAAELGIGVGLFLLLPLALREPNRPKLDSRTHRLLLLQAICGIVLYRVFIFWGLQYTTAATGGLISSTAPACIAVNLAPFFNNSSHAADAFKGNCLVFVAVLCEAEFSVMSKATCTPMSAVYRTTLVSAYAFCGLLSFALYDMQNFDIAVIDNTSLVCIIYYGVFVSFFSYVFWFKGIASVPTSTGGAFTGFVPVSGVLLSWLFLRGSLSLGLSLKKL